jgi:hypothetical protein
MAPSYAEIKEENTIHDPDDYEILISAEITPGMDVLLNGILIASAPEYKQTVTGKIMKLPQPEQIRFCRGVIWWLLNDENCLKDKLAEIGYMSPAKIDVPDHIIENITLAPFPGPGLLRDIETAEICKSADLIRALDELDELSPYYEGRDIPEYENVELSEYWPHVMKEIIESGLDKPQGWIPHLKVRIEEVPA